MQWHLRQVFDFINIFLTDLLTLSPVVDIPACDTGGDTEEYEPVSGREFGSFVEP